MENVARLLWMYTLYCTNETYKTVECLSVCARVNLPRLKLMSNAVWAYSMASEHCPSCSRSSESLLHSLSWERTLLVFTAMGRARSLWTHRYKRSQHTGKQTAGLWLWLTFSNKNYCNKRNNRDLTVTECNNNTVWFPLRQQRVHDLPCKSRWLSPCPVNCWRTHLQLPPTSPGWRVCLLCSKPCLGLPVTKFT